MSVSPAAAAIPMAIASAQTATRPTYASKWTAEKTFPDFVRPPQCGDSFL
jgi:hypothetical protein